MFSKRLVMGALFARRARPITRVVTQWQHAVQIPLRTFAAPVVEEEDLSGSSQKRITARTLCEITGTKYYLHNSEIGFQPERRVKVYDEND